MSDYLCNDCLDTGWIEDREGKTVCACISETEPYQLLRAENEALRKCCTQRGARMQIMREWMVKQDEPHMHYGWLAFTADWQHPEALKWFDADGVPVEDAALRGEGEK